jgi:hypothetical protein
MSDSMHVVGSGHAAGVGFSWPDTNRTCTPVQINPVHGRPNDFNYLNYDFRMKYGLPILRYVTQQLL